MLKAVSEALAQVTRDSCLKKKKHRLLSEARCFFDESQGYANQSLKLVCGGVE
jgi:hypothetical protein